MTPGLRKWVNLLEAGVVDFNEKVIKAEENPQKLDDIPWPDKDLLYQFPKNRDNPIKNILTSRGCPFSCPYYRCTS